MWSGIGAAGLAGAMSIGGSLIGSSLNRDFAEDSAAEAYARQLQLLQYQQQYATRMSNTAHRREVRDLILAGLNPILSATGGQGASSPVVSAPSVQQAQGVDYGDLGMGKAGDAIGRSSAFTLAKNQAAEVKKNSESQRALNDANASSAKGQQQLAEAQAKEVSANSAADRTLKYEQAKTEQQRQETLKAQEKSFGKRNLYELPYEVVRQRWEHSAHDVNVRMELDREGRPHYSNYNVVKPSNMWQGRPSLR